MAKFLRAPSADGMGTSIVNLDTVQWVKKLGPGDAGVKVGTLQGDVDLKMTMDEIAHYLRADYCGPTP